MKADGRSVMLSSHIFSEVEKPADQVTISRGGVKVASGTIPRLRLHQSPVPGPGCDGIRPWPGRCVPSTGP
jgi:ABC-2 type transport system ATP-binding protein